MLGDPENYRCKAVQKKMARAQSPFRVGERTLHSYGVLCIKVSTLAFPSRFILISILCMGKLRHVEVFVTSLGSCVVGVTVESTGQKS